MKRTRPARTSHTALRPPRTPRGTKSFNTLCLRVVFLISQRLSPPLPLARRSVRAMVVYNFKKITQVPTAKDFVDIILSKTQRKTPTGA